MSNEKQRLLAAREKIVSRLAEIGHRSAEAGFLMYELVACEEAVKELEREEKRLARFPNSCPTCRGTGGHVSWFDPSPSGVSLGYGLMMDFEPCADCVEKGICPLCGEESLDEDGGHCLKCGWDIEKSEEVFDE